MSLDVLMVSALCREINEIATGAKLDRIFQPEKDVVIISLRTSSGNRKILISVNPASSRIHFTDRNFDNPEHPPMFCMLLRKHLNGAYITSISQPNSDRIVQISLKSSNELGDSNSFSLYVELMGKNSNLVIVDKDGRIVDCLRRKDYAGDLERSLLPGMFYRLPPSQGKTHFFNTEENDLKSLAGLYVPNSDISDFLRDVFCDLSPVMRKEIIYSSNCSDLCSALLKLKTNAENGNSCPIEYIKDHITVEVSSIPLSFLENEYDTRIHNSFSNLLDAVYISKDEEEHSRRISKDLTSKVRTKRDRLKKKISGQMLEIHSESELEDLRQLADLITANIYRIKRGDRVLHCENYYITDSPEIDIPLDPLKTPQQNSASLYKEYRKKKTAAVVLRNLVETEKKELDYLNSVMDELSRCRTIAQLEEIKAELVSCGCIRYDSSVKRKKKTSGPDLYSSSDGYKILAGRNNLQNDELTLKTARRSDYWFHVKGSHGSHVVLCCCDDNPSDTAVIEASMLAAFLSESSCSGKVAVDYTQVRNVKKPSGAYPGYVIYSDYKTVIVASDDPGLNKQNN